MTTTQKPRDELRPEYDLSKLGPAVRGKYFERYRAGTLIFEKVVRIPGCCHQNVSVPPWADHAVGEALSEIVVQGGAEQIGRAAIAIADSIELA